MSDQHSEVSNLLANELGFSTALLAHVESLLERFNVTAMLPDEQAIFVIEIARIVHDRYQQFVEETVSHGGPAVPSYEEIARDTLAELMKEASV
jgi:hypothetical protein